MKLNTIEQTIMSRSVISDLLTIFKAGYSAVQPDKIIRKCLTYDPTNDVLNITGNKYDLSKKNVYVVGAGKAVQYMAREIDNILGSKVKKAIISVPAKSLASDTRTVNTNFIYSEGAQDNLPDRAAECTAKNIKDLALGLTAKDFLLVLISGGGSALLPLPKEPVTLEEKLSVIKKLAKSGADINELNIVRKKISAIKGGKLAMAAYPAQTVTLILSDVVNDPLDIIASGPTVEDNDDVENAISVIKKYNLFKTLPESIKLVFETETLPVVFEKYMVENYLLGTNKVSIAAAFEEAHRNNFTPIVLSRSVVGNVRDVAKKYVELSIVFCDYLQGKLKFDQLIYELSKVEVPGLNLDIKALKRALCKNDKLCLILGGETTVEVKGNGKGGRNQQLALEFSKYIHGVKDKFKGLEVYMLSGGTDGIDGPTDAAGAIGYLNLVSDCEKSNIDVQEYLDNNDSYNFYKHFKFGIFHVITGHTNTNVMDLHLIAIRKN